MPRGKKNKGPAPKPNINKAKSPVPVDQTKVAESTIKSNAAPLPVESDASNDDLKARLANAKERLHLLQEVIGGIGDPTDIENFKASGIDAAKEKLNIIQDSVNSVKTTLLEVRQDATRSVTPEGSPSGTSKKRKNKKHQNQNPPQGFVTREQPAPDVTETKPKTEASENEGSALEQEDGNSTISKKKRNRNKNKKGQQEQSPVPESLPQEPNASNKVDAVKIDIPVTEASTKENSPEANKSKNNKKNNKKGQQKSTNENIDSNTTPDIEIKLADLKKDPVADVKANNQPPSNDKNKNKNKNKNKKAEGNNKEVEKSNESTEDQKNKSKDQGDNIVESKTDNTVKDISEAKQTSNKVAQDPPTPKEDQKKTETDNVKNQQPKVKNDQKKVQNVEEKPAANNENLPPTEASKTPEKEQNIKTQLETQKLHTPTPTNKKDKKKGQTADSKQSCSKVEQNKAETKISEETTKVASEEVPSTEVVNTEALPKNKPKEIDTQPSKIEMPKIEKDKNQSQTPKSEMKTEKPCSTSAAPIEEEIASASSQTQKIKKNKQQIPSKIAEKQDESLPSKLSTDISSEKTIAEISEAAIQAQSREIPIQKEKCNKDEVSTSTPAVVTKSLEKQEEAIPSTVQIECEKILVDKVDESPKPTVVKDVTDKNQIEMAVTPSLPKLDFSQVVKDNKDKIPLMEIKALPVLPAEVENKTIDSVNEASIKTLDAEIKSVPEVATTDKPFIDILSKPSASPTAEASSKSIADIPASKEVKDATGQTQKKSKTPEPKGNQANQKNEQKKPQQGKGQCMKQKQNDQKSRATKEDEVKPTEVAKVDSESKVTAVATVVPVDAVKEIKEVKEEVTKKNENTKKVEQRSEDNKLLDTAQKKQPQIQDKTDKDNNKKCVVDVVADVKGKTTGEIHKKDNKSGSSTSQNSPINKQVEPPKQDQKAELSKKDQKKQNKMKGKAPQPPDIPMDMSLLSASMIDSSTKAADEIISHEESEDQSSLITSDSKNVEGSDFVQSVNSSLRKATTDETKSLETVTPPPKNENKVDEIERETKNSSPSSSKRNKDMANLKESIEMQETKRQELPEKSAQQKLEPVQFPAVKLLDILEAKMTSPTVKPGQIAGNVRKLPKDNNRRPDQLNVQQQKSRSKSPKENVAEKFVKNQKLASGDNKKQAVQNLKNEILKTEIGSVVTPSNKEKEVKEPTKTDANLNESKSTSGTEPITIAVSDSEQVGKLKDSNVISKQAEPLPKNSTPSDPKLQQQLNDDAKAGVAVGGKKESANNKPKIAPKPSVPLKTSPTDRSKKSPVKTPESKTTGKVSPGKETATQLKSAAPSKQVPQSKSPSQTKSPSQSKEPSKTTEPTQASGAQCPNTTRPEVPPKPNLASTNKVSPPPTQDEEEEFVEYKFTPRPVFISTACQICKVPLDTPNPCKLCQMVSYCSEEHANEDHTSHVPLCNAIQEIAKKRGRSF